MRGSTPPLPLRRALLAGLAAALLAVALAHAYRFAYLAAGGPAFPEIGALPTTLAAFVPVLLAGPAYALALRLVPRGRAVFTAAVLALGALSAVPAFVAPLHEGFWVLSAPLHLLVAGTAAFGVPALAAGPLAPPSRPGAGAFS